MSFHVFQYAIKSIRKKKIATKQDLGRIRREIEIMSTLGHPHIISVYEGMTHRRVDNYQLCSTSRAC